MNWQRIAVIAGLSAALGAQAAANPPQPKEVTAVEGMTEYQFPNGLKVLLVPDVTKPTVTVNLTVLVGSRHEGYGETGMAHLLEHMLFKGTPTHQHIPKELKERGADFNGTTWLDRTNYFETLPASDRNLEFAIRLEADRLVNSYVKKEDLASEMTVVRNEFERGENQPEAILDQRMVSAAFEWHNYGHATIGNRADIERVPIQNLQAFYRRYYQPDNCVLVVAGRFDAKKALEIIADSLGKIPRPERTLDKTYTEEPPQDGERFVELRRVGDVAVVGALFHTPSGAHPDNPAFDVLENILTTEPTGRLYKALVETKRAAQVYGMSYSLHDPGVLELMAVVSQGNDPKAVLEALVDTLDDVAAQGVKSDEVERAKRRLLKTRELAAANSQRLAIELSDWAAQGDWRLYFLYRDRLEKITPEDVSRIAKAYLQPTNRTVGMFIPTSKTEHVAIPAAPDVASMVTDYKGRKAIQAGEAFDVAPDKIEQRTVRQALPEGIKATILEKKTRGESVHMTLVLRYGNEQNLRGMATAAEFLPALMKRGTKKLTETQLKDELDKNQAVLSATGSAGEATFSIQTVRAHFPDVLRLLQQVLREPTLPQAEFDILKQQQISDLEQQLKEPSTLARLAVRRTMYPYPSDDPRYIANLEEEIQRVKALTLDDVKKLYHDFLGAHQGELAIVGDFDAKTAMPVINEMLADWKPKQPYERLRYEVRPGVTGSARDILTPGKANAMYFAAMAFPVRDNDPDYPALTIGNFILGGGALSSRLADRVRQKDGLSYGIRSGIEARSLDPRAAFYVYAICNPANMNKLKAAIREEIDRYLKDGVSEQEVQNAIKGFLENEQVRRSSDNGLAAILADTSFATRDMRYYSDLETKIRQLTPEAVMAAMRKYINPDKLIIVAAGDLQQAEAGTKDSKAKP